MFWKMNTPKNNIDVHSWARREWDTAFFNLSQCHRGENNNKSMIDRHTQKHKSGDKIRNMVYTLLERLACMKLVCKCKP